MSTHSKTPYIIPSMDFSSGKGVVRGRRGQQLELALVLCFAAMRLYSIIFDYILAMARQLAVNINMTYTNVPGITRMTWGNGCWHGAVCTVLLLASTHLPPHDNIFSTSSIPMCLPPPRTEILNIMLLPRTEIPYDILFSILFRVLFSVACAYPRARTDTRTHGHTHTHTRAGAYSFSHTHTQTTQYCILHCVCHLPATSMHRRGAAYCSVIVIIVCA